MINTKQILAHYGLTPNKALGQNFIEDENALNKILAAADTDGRAVLEIGPGLGTLTQGLLEKAAKVVAVEIDTRLVAVLDDRFKDCKNLEIVHGDILKTNLSDLHARLGGGEFIVAGNLPYHITTPICSMLTESDLPIAGMTLMVQQEAAQRFFAGPKDRIYGPMARDDRARI